MVRPEFSARVEGSRRGVKGKVAVRGVQIANRLGWSYFKGIKSRGLLCDRHDCHLDVILGEESSAGLSLGMVL